MRIAVTYEDGRIFQHFGHTEQFCLYDIERDAVASKTILSTNGNGHGALVDFLKERKVEALICGGIGAGARTALDEAGIRLYGGVTGWADEAVSALLSDNLDFNPDVKCDHHDHGLHDNHACGEHGCGSHGCTNN